MPVKAGQIHVQIRDIHSLLTNYPPCKHHYSVISLLKTRSDKISTVIMFKKWDLSKVNWEDKG
jgi:hypothetical protein